MQKNKWVLSPMLQDLSQVDDEGSNLKISIDGSGGKGQKQKKKPNKQQPRRCWGSHLTQIRKPNCRLELPHILIAEMKMQAQAQTTSPQTEYKCINPNKNSL